MTDLFDKLDTPSAEGWRPEDGDKIVGRVIACDTRDGSYGEYPVVTLDVREGSTETRDGVRHPIELPAERAVHAFHTILKGEIWTDGKVGAWRVHEGDTLGVRYNGKGRTRAGNEIDNYRVIIERPTVADKLDDDAPSLFST